MQTLYRKQWYAGVHHSIPLYEINPTGHQNITAFLMDQNRQFQDAIYGLNYAKETLDAARSGLSGKFGRQRC